MASEEDNDETARAEAARHGSPFLNSAQTAHYLRISVRTLEKLTEKGEGPPFRTHGNQKAFHIADIENWSAQRKRNSPRHRKTRETP